MRLVVPYIHEPEPSDTRLIQLAGFCGVPCDTVRLDTGINGLSAYLASAIATDNCCVVVNPATIRKWSSAESFPDDLASYLVARFPFLLVHNLDEGPFSSSVLRHLSGDRLASVQALKQSHLTYEVAAEHQSICSVFSGLTFGPIDTVNDRVLEGKLDSAAVQSLIAIGGRPSFARVIRDRTQVFFLAGKNIADIRAEAGALRSLRNFSQLVPPVMLLRHVFPDECWRPNARHATLIIDDPLLQERYGFLNYARLLALMDRYDFHTSIAFIPRNRFRTSSQTAKLFRERPDRYSLCVHGNDHTAGELGTSDEAQLNTLLQTAVRRMEAHRHHTSIPYDKVMVFPQGVFSEAAMRALKANNFAAAVNSHPHPRNESSRLRLTDYIQPAITGYGGFPLLLRKYVRELTPYDAAFSLFFGQPLLIVEHHGIFKDADLVSNLVSRINSLAPDIHWSNLQTAVESSFLKRGTPDGNLEVLTYAACAKLTSTSQYVSRCSVMKPDSGDVPLRHVLLNEAPLTKSADAEGRITFCFDLPPGMSQRCSLEYHNNLPLSAPRSELGEIVKIELRRRASEIRDNYLSKSPRLLSVAQRVQRLLRS